MIYEIVNSLSSLLSFVLIVLLHIFYILMAFCALLDGLNPFIGKFSAEIRKRIYRFGTILIVLFALEAAFDIFRWFGGVYFFVPSSIIILIALIGIGKINHKLS